MGACLCACVRARVCDCASGEDEFMNVKCEYDRITGVNNLFGSLLLLASFFVLLEAS